MKAAGAKKKAKEAGDKDVTAKEKDTNSTMVGSRTARVQAFVTFVNVFLKANYPDLVTWLEAGKYK